MLHKKFILGVISGFTVLVMSFYICFKMFIVEILVNAPELKIEQLSLVDMNNNEIDLNELKGQIVFLNFWATWCVPCIAEFEGMDNLLKILDNPNLTLLAISDEELEKVQDFAKDQNYSFQFVKMSNTIGELKFPSLPVSYVIDIDKRKTLFKFAGATQWDSEQMQKIFSSYLNKKKVVKQEIQ
ncbi:TlpA family protein disulfide reductase [Sphingobacteriaceae bacterium AH-315-L07]|nr:TlpA family protein disulfide reductase [Sphingobacteriaceae bacterium AH-315-L07]